MLITKWFELGDGTLISRSLEVEGTYAMALHVPGDAVEISQERAEEIRAAHAAQVRAWVAAQLEKVDETRRCDYEALVGVGVPEVTARRLSGYQGGGRELGGGADG